MDQLKPYKILTFTDLSLANSERLNIFPGHDEQWSHNDWMVAVTGEIGELANKLKRLRRGVVVRGKKLPTRDDLAEELADVVIYLDLLSSDLGIDLGEAVRWKFNIVSDEISCNIKL